jgi:hypothetical protein
MTVTNSTEKEFIVLVKYPSRFPEFQTKTLVNAAEVKEVFDELVAIDRRGESFSYFNLWAYNIKDSTYCILGEKGVYIKNEQWNYILGQYYSYTLNHVNPEEYRGNYSFVIDESLLPKMVKNTHLTDSVFGLKK